MLIELVHQPTAYCIDLTLSPSDQTQAASARHLALLPTLAEDFLLVMDAKNGDLRPQIFAFIESWPEEYKADAKDLLARMDDMNRIIYVEEKLDGDWHEPYCAKAVALSATVGPDAIIGPDHCCCGGRCDELANELGVTRIPVSRVGIDSRLRAMRQRRHSFTKFPGEAIIKDLENDVLRPIFRHANRASVYDHYLGINVYESLNEAIKARKLELSQVAAFVNDRVNGRPATLTVTEPDVLFSYKIFASFIYKMFANHNRRGSTLRFHTEVRPRKASDNSDWITAASVLLLREMTQQMMADFPSECSCDIAMIRESRERDRQGEVVYPGDHDRFLATDAIALMIGKGLNIMDMQGRSVGANITKISPDAVPFRSYANLDTRIDERWIKRSLRL